MSVALTFGSLGDIIALCGLAVGFSKALSSTQGSVQAYQGLKHELDQFVQVLMHDIETFQVYENNEWLNTLANVTKDIINECGSLIGEVSGRYRQKYQALDSDGSWHNVKSLFQKVEFSVRETERIQLLHDKLNNAIGRLSLLTSCAILYVPIIATGSVDTPIDGRQPRHACQRKHPLPPNR